MSRKWNEKEKQRKYWSSHSIRSVEEEKNRKNYVYDCGYC